MSKRFHAIKACAAAAASVVLSQTVLAAVSAEEAKQLGTTLTEFGAEKAGNADGSIPAYTGGVTKAPAGFKSGGDGYIDPFKDDKPLYVVDGKNLSKYQDQLTEGTKVMLARFPTYRLDVYPTRRSVAYPAWVRENSVKNATTAKLSGEIEGDNVSGADADGNPFAGVPFPIPKNGYEVMWNHKMSFGPTVDHDASTGWLVDTSGTPTALPTTNQFFIKPWYDRSGKLRKQVFDAVFGFSATMTAPPSSAGVHFLNYYLANSAEGGQKVWFYTPGQRRVRAAPEFAYDIPIAAYGGVLVWDEIFGFVGRMDRFNFKLVGKKEMIVPYNVYGITNQATSKESLGPKHINPDVLRWEKRRIWIVDAKRKENARHSYSRRTFYIEEDCWCIVATESYDSANQLWRAANLYTFPTYDTGGVNTSSWSFNDLIKGNYFVINIGRKDPGNFVRSYADAEGLPIKLTPQAVAAGSVR